MAEAKYAIIIGAGPAGLTAAYEFLTRSRIRPIVLEKGEYLGGISRTVVYKGNRMDIGGHRFFSKSDRVMNWWLKMLPMEQSASDPVIGYHGLSRGIERDAAAGPDAEGRVMLLRPRKSRILYRRRLFDYPVKLSLDTIRKFGLLETVRIGFSYLKSALFPRKPERTLEDFLINRFGKVLYSTFFKSYTEKVWGVPCDQIPAEWGAQRIKGLSMRSALMHAARKVFRSRGGDVKQKGSETSLIERFLYPRLGPGQMWEETARRIGELGGEIRHGWSVDRVHTDGWRVTSVDAVNGVGERQTIAGDYFISTAPIQELMRSFDVAPPKNVLEVSDGLVYRDFITVGILVRSLKIDEETPQGRRLISDNWIYVQESDVQLGRLQIFNNWSADLVRDPNTVWMGLEYFCNTTDAIWNLSDAGMIELATAELAKIGFIHAGEVLDATVLRVEKTYPAYLGTYDRFAEVRRHVDQFENLYLVGRNGMHRYNNQDHSMLTAMMAVDQIVEGRQDKAALWEVNTEMDYHEEKADSRSARARN
jgi:protoporphyrinogen oxidase